MGKKRKQSIFHIITAVVLSILLLLPAVPVWAVSEQYDSVDGLSSEILYDTEGERVYACGGEVHQFTENGVTKWYWFGVDDLEKNEGETKQEGIHLYSSSDLYNWENEGVIWNIEGAAHPKVLYNEMQKQYVMWVSTMGGTSVGISDSIKGPFTPISDTGADNIMGFINLYEESPGTAYAVYEEYNGVSSDICLGQLSSDYKNIEGTPQKLRFKDDSLVNAEGGIFKRAGKYYIVNAGMTQYAVADSLTGEWTVKTLQMWDGTAYKDISDKNQTSNVFHVKTEESEEYVCIGDSVGGDDGKVRYIWLPIVFFSDDVIALRELSNWKIEIDGNGSGGSDVPIRYDSIDGFSGEILYDTEGERVYACGGEVHQVEEDGVTKWYWFGVNDLESDGQQNNPGIHLYSSTDLYNWEHEGRIDGFESDFNIAHPKVLYNEKDKQYVMWVSIGTEMTVATSKSIKGPFTVVEEAGEASGLSGFINLYKDNSGTAYVIYCSENGAFSGAGDVVMAKLSADYTRIEGSPQAFQYTDNNKLYCAEGGIFERNGKYYIVNAGNPDEYGPQYAVADSLDGPWTVHPTQMWDNESQKFEDIVNKNQTSNVFHVKTKDTDTYVCVGDSVNGDAEPGKVRYIWLPVKFFGDGKIALEKLSNWNLDSRKTVIEVTEVKLNTESKMLKVGENCQITATVLPVDADDKTLEYVSSDELVATVSESGKIEAKKAGKTTITVISVNGKKAELQVEVQAEEETREETTEETTEKTTEKMTEKTTEKTTVDVQSVRVSTKKMTVGIGEKVRLKANVYPNNASDKKLTYKASNNKVKIDKKGKITARKTGTCKITVSSSNGRKVVVRVTVKKKPNKISLNAKRKTLKVGKKFQIKPRLPKGTASYQIMYASNRKSVAEVSLNGKVTAKKKGNAVITVSTYNGKKAILKIHVK